MSFIFKIIAKSPPSILFALAALAFITANATKEAQAWQWVSNFFWAGMVLQVFWLVYKAWFSRR